MFTETHNIGSKVYNTGAGAIYLLCKLLSLLLSDVDNSSSDISDVFRVGEEE